RIGIEKDTGGVPDADATSTLECEPCNKSVSKRNVFGTGRNGHARVNGSPGAPGPRHRPRYSCPRGGWDGNLNVGTRPIRRLSPSVGGRWSGVPRPSTPSVLDMHHRSRDSEEPRQHERTVDPGRGVPKLEQGAGNRPPPGEGWPLLARTQGAPIDAHRRGP